MNKHKRFLLISFGWYYPDGGMFDVEDSVDNKEDAIKWFNEGVKSCEGKHCPSASFQVFDCDERELIANWQSKN